jgi:hypothetical protein
MAPSCNSDVSWLSCDRNGAGGFHQLGEIASVDELHDQEMPQFTFIGVVGRDDIGMVQACGGANFFLKSPHEGFGAGYLLLDHLDRHDALHAAVQCLEHSPHAPVGNPIQDEVIAHQEPQAATLADLMGLVVGQHSAGDEPRQNRGRAKCLTGIRDRAANVDHRARFHKTGLRETLLQLIKRDFDGERSGAAEIDRIIKVWPRIQRKHHPNLGTHDRGAPDRSLLVLSCADRRPPNGNIPVPIRHSVTTQLVLCG